jgi:GT2 family glycosyltransferase
MSSFTAGTTAEGEPRGPAVAIAVVSWNTRELLGRCLESMRPAVDAGLAEAWVVDNGSEDGSPELVRDEHGWARLLELERNVGFGAAVNLVAERTATPWLAPANADVEVPAEALKELLETGDANRRAGAIAPRLLLPDGSTQHSVYRFPTLGFTALFNLGIPALSRRLGDRLCLEGAWDPERPRRVPWAIGAFLLVRREAWDEVGGFSEEQWMYAEDLDLGWRLARAGWETLYEPAAVVRHHSAAATRQAWGEERTERWQRSTYAWMLRRRGALLTRLVALVNVVGTGARRLLLAPAALLGSRRARKRRASLRRWGRLHALGLGRREDLSSPERDDPVPR